MSGETAILPTLAGTKEAAAIFGVRTQNFLRDWAKRPDFPAPVANLAATPVWRRDDLEAYRARNRPIPWPPRRRGVRLSPEAHRWLPAITRRLVDAFHPDRIILFGSQARGDATDHSDIDLLVVLPSVASRHAAAADMYASLEGIPAGTDIHVVSVADVERYDSSPGTIVRPALAEGTLVYVSDDARAAVARTDAVGSVVGDVETDLKGVTDRLVEALHPSRIVLFGSMARGDARPDSDIDLLVVMPALAGRHRTTAAALRAIGPLDRDVDVVAVSEAEVQARGSVPGTAINDALTHGKVLYAGG